MTPTHHGPRSNAQVLWARGDDADRLVTGSGPDEDVFVSPAWVRAAWRHLPERGEPLILAVRIGPHLWWLPMSERRSKVCLAGAPFGDRHDLAGPCGPQRDWAARIAVESLDDHDADVHLHAVRYTGALATALERHPRWTVKPEPSPLIPTGPRCVRGAARRLRRVERYGRTEITVRYGDELDAARVCAFARARREAWRARGREIPSTERLDGFDSFLAEAVAGLALDGQARLWELRTGAAVIAQDLHLGRPDSPLLYMRAYDPSWAALSPGTVLLEQVLHILNGRHVAVLDSGRGAEPYKLTLGGDATVVLNAFSAAPGRSADEP